MHHRGAQDHERHIVAHLHRVAELEMWNPPAQDAAAWNAPIANDLPLTIEELKRRETQAHVDHVQDMVPFWIKGVEAAEKGEVLRLEHFLETLQEASDAWMHPPSENSWVAGNSDQGWNQDWGNVDRWDGGVNAWGTPRSSAKGSIRSEQNSSSSSQVRRRRQIPGPTSGPRRQQMESQRDRNINRPRQSFTNAFDFVEYIAKQKLATEEQKRQMHTFFAVRSWCSLQTCVSWLSSRCPPTKRSRRSTRSFDICMSYVSANVCPGT